MTYKLDNPIFFTPDKAHPDRHIQIGKWRGPIALDGDIDAQIDALPLTDEEKATAKVEIRKGWTTLQARPPEPSLAPVTMDTVRRQRDAKLAACDWTQVADAPLTTDQVTAWKTYRQSLRDLPANTPDPANVKWSTPPG
jgi:hypothetical protein